MLVGRAGALMLIMRAGTFVLARRAVFGRRFVLVFTRRTVKNNLL